MFVYLTATLLKVSLAFACRHQPDLRRPECRKRVHAAILEAMRENAIEGD